MFGSLLSRVSPLGRLFLLAPLFVLLASCYMPIAPPLPKDLKDGYFISGTATSVTVQYADAQWNNQTVTLTSLPWSKDIGASKLFAFVQNNTDSGAVKVELYVGGKVVSSGATSGPHGSLMIFN